jgi:MFS family permease
VKRTFSSLRIRNYRLFFSGQAVSQTGSWMQRIALSWYVLQLTHGDSFAVGIMALAQFLPFTLFGLFAGVITDRLDARRLVIWTQAGQLVTAVALTAIALSGVAVPWMLYTIAFLNGLILVLDVPSRQQLTYRMVGRDTLPNAIALNSSLFNASRIFGPSLAGIILGFAGVGVCFIVNAVSFLAVLLGLLAMRTSEFFPVEEFERPSILSGTREGLAFVRRQPRMLIVLGLTVILSTFCFNFNVTLPVLAYNTLHTHAAVYGILSAAFGAGALVGALAAASLSKASARTMIIGALVFTGGELLLAPAKSALLVGVLLFVVGAGFTVWSANSNASMQLAAPDRLRGRIIGLYFYAFNGTGPLGGLLAGWLCATGGTELAFVVAGIVGLAGTGVAAHRFRDLNSAGRARAHPVRGQGRSHLASVTHNQSS